MKGYEVTALLLLAIYEDYLPYMSDDEVCDILQWGQAPAPWQVKVWESRRAQDKGRLESLLNRALAKQK